MTSNYRDFTSYVSSSSRANDYTPLGNYSTTGFQTVPPSSLMKLTVAPGGEKYFSTAPSFQARLDNTRIAPPAKTPITIGMDTPTASGSTMMSVEGVRQVTNSDYASLGGAYKLNPY